MAVLGGLLHNCGVNGVALFEGLFRWGPLGDEAGDPRLRAGFLLRLVVAVEGVCGNEATGGDIEAALYSGNDMLAHLMCFPMAIDRSVGT